MERKQLFTITVTNKHGSTPDEDRNYGETSGEYANKPGDDSGDKKAVTFGFSAKKVSLAKETKELTFETKEEALAAFYELLANKGVRPQSTWVSLQSKLRRDPRYTALKSEAERKRAFAKYKTDLILPGNEALILAEKSRLKRIRVNFKMYLREILRLNRLEEILTIYGKYQNQIRIKNERRRQDQRG